jgi:hypothetical protein
MADAAFTLAALRAGRTRSLSERDRSGAEAVVARLGRRLVEVGDANGMGELTLGFTDGYEPNPGDDLFSVRRLSPVPLVALAACLGLCWIERDEPPYPGRSVEIEHVLDVTGALGADRAHTIGAIRHELTPAGLLRMTGTIVRLGPALAAWTDAQVDALRRFADALPGTDA